MKKYQTRKGYRRITTVMIRRDGRFGADVDVLGRSLPKSVRNEEVPMKSEFTRMTSSNWTVSKYGRFLNIDDVPCSKRLWWK